MKIPLTDEAEAQNKQVSKQAQSTADKVRIQISWFLFLGVRKLSENVNENQE